MSSGVNMTRAALTLASRGLYVFPCSPKDSKPLCDGGFHAATRWPELITLWWRRFPNAMIGVRTGEKSKLWAIDLDRKRDRDGLASWRNLCDENGGELTTLWQDTPSGGRHFFFRWSSAQRIANSVCKLGEGIDVRGEGGYVIMAPSIRHDGNYRFGPKLSIIEAPQWLYRKINPPKVSRPATVWSDSPPSFRYANYADTALGREADAVASASEGQRNHLLNRAAFNLGQLVGAKALEHQRVQAALESAAECCGYVADHGWPNTRAVIRSGMDKGAETPRNLSRVCRNSLPENKTDYHQPLKKVGGK